MFSGSYSAKGGSDALEELLKTEFLKMIQKRELAQRDRSLDQQGSRDAVAAELGRGNLGVSQGNLKLGDRRVTLDENQFTEDNRRYGIEQPIRGRLQVAQAADIERRPQAEQQGREHDVTMAGIGNTNALGQIRARGDQDVRSIGAQGAEQRKTAGARIRMAGETQPQPTPYTDERGTRIRDSVAALKGKINGWTAGAGSLLTAIPATDARNFKAELDSLKANIAFGELAEMRAASKTGGALGAISERELALLESSLGALDQGQSPQNLAAQLDKIVQSLDRWSQAKASRGLPAAQNANDAGTEFDYVPGKGLVPRKRN